MLLAWALAGLAWIGALAHGWGPYVAMAGGGLALTLAVWRWADRTQPGPRRLHAGLVATVASLAIVLGAVRYAVALAAMDAVAARL